MSTPMKEIIDRQGTMDSLISCILYTRIRAYMLITGILDLLLKSIKARYVVEVPRGGFAEAVSRRGGV